MDLEGLSAVCSGLGYPDEGEDGVVTGYIKTESCLDNLKDIQRFLRRDDPETRDVFKQLCKWDTASRDLIPLMERYQTERNLVINAVKILVFLTMPISPDSVDIPRQMEYLWGLKAAITRSDTLAVIVSLLEEPLERLEREAFTEDDWKLVQLVLTLFRNVLAIQEITTEQKASGSSTQFLFLRDRLLELFFQENVMDLILVLTQHVSDSHGYLHRDNMLLLEIFHYMFLGQEPELIAKASQKNCKVGGDVNTSLNSLKSLMEEEKERRRLNRVRNLSRHSQFCGTFSRVSVDGSKKLCTGNLTSNDTLYNELKSIKGPMKRIIWSHENLSLPKENVMGLLHGFVNQFLSGAYNVLMQSIQEDIEKEKLTQNTDIIIFLSVAHFATTFQYHKYLASKPKIEGSLSEATGNDETADATQFDGDICGPIAATMNETMFLQVTSKWQDAFDGPKQTRDYKFLFAAGLIMKDMIQMLALVLKLSKEDSGEPQTARILLYKIFYDQTERGMTHFLLSLFRSFDTHNQSKSDLANLVEMIHTLIRLMEKLQARGTLRVAKKSRKSRKKTLRIDAASEPETLAENAIVQNADDPDGDNNPECVDGSKHLYSSRAGSLRNLSSDDEEERSNRIKEAEFSQPVRSSDINDLPQEEKHKDGLNNLPDETGDSSDGDQPPITKEVDFNVAKLVGSFASNSCVQNLCWLLTFYKRNSNTTNYCIVSLLKRICDDLNLAPVLYQLSLIIKFHAILADKKSSVCKEYGFIFSFLTTVVRRMLRKMKNQPLLFVELLFWKTHKDCLNINADSILQEVRYLKNGTRNWENNSDEGERNTGLLTGVDRTTRRSIADALGDDEADIPFPHVPFSRTVEDLADENFETQAIEDSRGSSGLVNRHQEGVKGGTQTVAKRNRRLVFDPEQEVTMKNLYDKFKDEPNCSHLIAEALDSEGRVSPVQVSAKLKQLGLKVVSKRKKRHDNEPPGGKSQAQAEEALMEDGSIQTSSSHMRKRVRAFRKMQEESIKELYDKYKDQKKCSQMIANALDAGSTYTATQISRKLRQLGLVTARKRKLTSASEDSKQNDAGNLESAEREAGSDEETLMAMKKRKSKRNDKLISKENPSTDAQQAREDYSSDEALSTLLKKNRKKVPHKLKVGNLKNVSSEAINTSANETPRAESESAGIGLPLDVASVAPNSDQGMEPSSLRGVSLVIDVADFDDNGDTVEVNARDEVEEGSGGASATNEENPTVVEEDRADDLADDDLDAVVPRSAGPRRKVRMILDPDDED
ncbi:hypothetical protein H6P81_014474 [Aristolochia fimbriata]|uniref:Timeless N-terminal domain-containing protein n=1 Tax=Aristolochia fimbriata TaxID=158543 RepID=A0AAV7EKF0_ARIFI|nr:hypothetical protein H6P81_014474 [Aristolochia fimbriata]